MLEESSKKEVRTKVPWAVVINTSSEASQPDTIECDDVKANEPAAIQEEDGEILLASDEEVAVVPEHQEDAVEPEAGAEGEDALDAADTSSEDVASDEASEDAESPECDDAVVRALTDVLIAPDGMVQPQERAFAVDLLLQVMDYASSKAKHHLCDRLSNMPNAPASLVARFINDPDLKISEALLLRASCVTDAELISVVEAGDTQRSVLIARRQHLSSAVSTALTKSGDPALARALVKNPCAKLGLEAIQRLAAMAPVHMDLMELLVIRTEMTTGCALHLFWSMPAKERAYVLGRFLADVQVLPQIIVMSKPGADLVATALRSGSGAGGRSEDDQSGQRQTTSKQKAAALVEALEAADADKLSHLIGEFAQVESAAADWIVYDEGGEPLAVACKALGVSRFAFGDALAKWHSVRPHKVEHEALQILFDTLSFRQARMALTYWDWQARKIGPYQNYSVDLNKP